MYLRKYWFKSTELHSNRVRDWVGAVGARVLLKCMRQVLRGWWNSGNLQKKWELYSLRVCFLLLTEETLHHKKCDNGKIGAFWYSWIGWNTFLMTLSILSKWFNHPFWANCFVCCNVYYAMKVYYLCWKFEKLFSDTFYEYHEDLHVLYDAFL